jgi:hypothetical protein
MPVCSTPPATSGQEPWRSVRSASKEVMARPPAVNQELGRGASSPGHPSARGTESFFADERYWPHLPQDEHLIRWMASLATA